MQNLKIKTEDSKYPYYLAHDIDYLGKAIGSIGTYSRVAIITDSNVAKMYLNKALNSLKASDIEVFTLSFDAGERQKTHSTLQAVYDFLVESKITRGDLIVALGGGVVGDLVGYAAATFLRGVAFAQVPTTLLAAVDSSVGGKVGINLSCGKNLVGCFYQPKMVFCDINCLTSLPPKEIKNGLGEIIKYGCIAKPKIIEMLEADPAKFLEITTQNLAEWENLIALCVEYKAQIVSRDTREKGIRQVLNFGHTFAHCIETHSNYLIPHGEAVATGICLINDFGVAAGLTDIDIAQRIKKLVKALGFATQYDAPKKELFGIAINDKKRFDQSITLVILHSLGKVVLHSFPYKLCLEKM